jgi:glutathione S-transferase
MAAKLYVIPASPPCLAVAAAFRLKGVPYKLVELPPVLHVLHQKARFGNSHVPSALLGRVKVTGSMAIMRRLEAIAPTPALFGREGNEQAERWAEDELQAIGRRLIWGALARRPEAMPSLLRDSKLPMPTPLARKAGAAVTPIALRRNGSRDAAIQADLATLSDLTLSRIELWIERGVIGTDAPTAADLQIGAVIGMLLRIEDVAPLIEPHERIVALSRRWFPDYPGHVPAGAFPAEWIPRASSAA